MKFTLSWLKDHLETDATLEQICERLTAIGLEVEDVDDKAAFKPFVIAKVISAEKHPQADKLKVLMVDTGVGRARSGRLRRAECARRPCRRFCGTRHLCSRHRRDARRSAISAASKATA